MIYEEVFLEEDSGGDHDGSEESEEDSSDIYDGDHDESEESEEDSSDSDDNADSDSLYGGHLSDAQDSDNQVDDANVEDQQDSDNQGDDANGANKHPVTPLTPLASCNLLPQTWSKSTCSPRHIIDLRTPPHSRLELKPSGPPLDYLPTLVHAHSWLPRYSAAMVPVEQGDVRNLKKAADQRILEAVNNIVRGQAGYVNHDESDSDSELVDAPI
ncbi:hypothetical protein FN846DRAFT_906375 [Sphaerosporella brunnea]|uniref:Uncharacterized protein n=1 Tax=Sphaerosporella brunnea TaxID=1250544 RepID=A0A5J5EYI9_9PEZI|nr:hypothetical protein FN846DRAFT_906375 [Sphaerosporella brunnea]